MVLHHKRDAGKEMLALETGLAATAEALAQERHKFVDPALCRQYAQAAKPGATRRGRLAISPVTLSEPDSNFKSDRLSPSPAFA